MQWCEAIVHTTTEGADAVSEQMIRFGATGTEIVDRADVPDPSKPGVYWELYDPKMLEAMPQDVLVKGWFEQNEHTHDVLGNLRAQLLSLKTLDLGMPLGTLEMELQNVADEDWAENWKKYYKPFRIGSHLVVKPTWEPYALQSGDVLVELDPGMAFGTGTHETTHMCMELLEKKLKSGMRVMDVGTGSGILAIAAAKLGAQDVLAIDIDPDAVKVARENVAHNKVDAQVRVVQGDLCKSEAMPCELAVANIVADAICMLAGPLTRHLLPHGLLVCSGIIREREQDVLDAAKEAGYIVEDRLTQGEWVALCLQNEAARA
ncbi:MAG: 50S ribosomal protein L11 methyltransferase [Eubacteriales bacterium]|nr:50S ribosomal protein L11 methyltransferase [Eubacteriales bacterium]